MIELFEVAGLVTGRLAVALRPRGGDWLDDDIRSLSARGWSVLVSALERDELGELELARLGPACRDAGIELIQFPIPDRGLPMLSDAVRLAEDLAARIATGAAVTAHCRQGIGRSSLIVAMVLVAVGVRVDDAWAMVATARGRSVPDTEEQRRWLASFASARGAGRSRAGPPTQHTGKG